MSIKNNLNIVKKARFNKYYITFILIFTFVIIFSQQVSIVFAGTGVNKQIPYSGSIVNNAGVVLPDNTYRAKFILWDALTGGNSVYEEIRDGITPYSGTVSPALSINDGRFDILLGSQNTNLPNISNNDSLYLEIQLDMDNNGSYEEVFNPRRRIGSTLSSINALRLVADGGVSTNTLSLDSTGNLVFTGDSSTERMKITGAGIITASSLGGATPNLSIPGGFDRIILANSSGQFSQVNISTLSGVSSGWGLSGNSTVDAWNGSSGTRIGTTSAQPFILATTNSTAQDIRFFTGPNGLNERMRILGSGNIGIGVTSPTSRLHLPAGSSSANTSPLKFTKGINLTNPESGAVEWDGADLYLTKDPVVASTGSVLREVVNKGLVFKVNMDFPVTGTIGSSSSYNDMIFPATGVSEGDIVSIGIPSSAIPSVAASFTAWVSATDQIRVRFNNHSTTQIQDPANALFRFFVTKVY